MVEWLLLCYEVIVFGNCFTGTVLALPADTPPEVQEEGKCKKGRKEGETGRLPLWV